MFYFTHLPSNNMVKTFHNFQWSNQPIQLLVFCQLSYLVQITEALFKISLHFPLAEKSECRRQNGLLICFRHSPVKIKQKMYYNQHNLKFHFLMRKWVVDARCERSMVHTWPHSFAVLFTNDSHNSFVSQWLPFMPVWTFSSSFISDNHH